MSSSQKDLTGAVLGGRYHLERALGRGGMGAVYEATELRLGRKVALKVLLPELGAETESVQRFRREAELAASLGHPNIVQVTDFFLQPGEPACLVMELLQGLSLREHLQRHGTLSYPLALAVAQQLLSALEAAHGVGVLHRDLKPDNVVLLELQGGGTFVKLIDFGLARLTESAGYAKLTATGVLLGTPHYMAPEQLLGHALDPRTDLFSLGVTLFHALTGRHPFHGASVDELVRAILLGPPPQLAAARPDLPRPFCDALERTLHRDPAHRWPDARSAREALSLLGPAPQPAGSSSTTFFPAHGSAFAAPAHGVTEPPSMPTAATTGGTPGTAPSPPAAAPPARAPLGGSTGLLVGVGLGVLLAVGVAVVTVALRSNEDEEPVAAAPSAPPASPAAPAVPAVPASANPFAAAYANAAAAAVSAGLTVLPAGGEPFRSQRFEASRVLGQLQGSFDREAAERAAAAGIQAALRCLDGAAGGLQGEFYLSLSQTWMSGREGYVQLFASGTTASLPTGRCSDEARAATPTTGVLAGQGTGAFAGVTTQYRVTLRGGS